MTGALKERDAQLQPSVLLHVAAIEGTVAGAAQRLRVTQPTVSEQLRTLERSLRVSLFERQVSGLKLTEAGRLAFEHTSQMFQAGERLLQALGHDPAAMPRTLRVGITGSVGRVTSTNFMMPLLALEGSVPSIRGGDGVDLIRDLRGNELDLAAGRLKTLATLATTHAGVFALYQDGETSDLARRAVHMLMEQVRSFNELDATTTS